MWIFCNLQEENWFQILLRIFLILDTRFNSNLMFAEWAFVLIYLFIDQMTWNKAGFTANILIFKEVNYGPTSNGC